MKRRMIYLILIIVLILIAVTGCGRKTEPSSFIGLVFSVDAGRVLVVQDIESAEIPEEEWFQAGKNAIWFTVDKKTALRDAEGKKITLDKITAGQQVEVLFSGAVAKSYPGQAEAEEIKILKAQ